MAYLQLLYQKKIFGISTHVNLICSSCVLGEEEVSELSRAVELEQRGEVQDRQPTEERHPRNGPFSIPHIRL